ncbi:MAG TPA: ATPase domain-containing protein [Solirubrobacteraceae bacterium]|nr:ATPase domain-containing protein [Solirubrobacteraceae bacterium]
MSDRLSSGQPRLDAILGGGLPADAINLIVGQPGTGKTILAEQYLFHNATEERPGLYLSTVSEPLEKLIRYGQTLSFFEPEAIGSRVIYEDLGYALAANGLQAVVDRVASLLRERRPGLLVIDSFKALEAFAENRESYRRALHELAGHLSAFPANCFWIGEYAESELGRSPEFAVADAILSLTTLREGSREMGLFQVLKLRGSDFRSGQHTYRIGLDGLRLFPRLGAAQEPTGYTADQARLSSGVAALDAMLDRGYWGGASTLIAGPSGGGKTLLGLHFIFKGAELGETGVIATLQENPIQLERMAGGFGWSLEQPNVELMYRSPIDIYLEEWFYDLLELIERTGASRVLVDSLGDLRLATTDELRFREYTYTLLQRCAIRGVSLMLTLETMHGGSPAVSDYGISNLSDNVVQLQLHRHRAHLIHTIAVLKTRASHHDPAVREFIINDGGIVLGEPMQRNPDE